jgi:hypothetical protein
MWKKKLLVFASLFLSVPSLLFATGSFHDDFSTYPDHDPAIRNWAFNGVGGGVIDGNFMFSVPLGGTQALARDFTAGSELRIKALVKACPHKFEYFNRNYPSGHIAVFFRADKFYRGKIQDKDIPMIMLMLDEKNGKKTFSLNASGRECPSRSPVIKISGDWQEGREYDMELSLTGGGKVDALVKDGDKTVFLAQWVDPFFARTFKHAYPGFASFRKTGEIIDFKADNLNSVPARRNTVLKSFPLPEKWVDKKSGKDVVFRPDVMTDLGALFGGHGSGKVVTLTSEVEVHTDCLAAVACRADWFWKLDVNGMKIADHMKRGTGNQFVDIIIPLLAGKNTISLTVGSGSGGWKFGFAIRDPESDTVRTVAARESLRGSDTLFWNLDRLMDDIANLERRGIELKKLRSEIVSMRKTLPVDLNSKEITKYNPFIDNAYARVYDGYRYIELTNAISEFEAFGIKNARLQALKKLAQEFKALLNQGNPIDETAVKAVKLIAELKPEMEGFTEGVSRGGSFGRFGWITSAGLGAYSGGDGLLANQVLADGGIARQYASNAENPRESFLCRFRFMGSKDNALSDKLFSRKAAYEDVEVEFGYLPGMFYTDKTPEEVKIHDINWIHKRFSYKKDFIADMSLASPSILLESPYNEFEIEDSKSGAFTHMAYKDAQGKVVSIKAGEDGNLYALDAHGAFGSNWIMLWNGNNTETDLAGQRGNVPLQIIFQRQPVSIERFADKIRIAFKQPGAIWLNTPYGARIQPTRNWHGFLTPKAVLKADFMGRTALAYPVNCNEFYRYNPEKKQVEILDKFTFKRFDDNDWQIKPLEVAPLPPLLSLMMDNGFDAVLPENLMDMDYPTIYGFLRGVPGSELRYSMSVPNVPSVINGGNPEADQQNTASIRRLSVPRIYGVRSFLLEERGSYDWHSLRFFTGILKQWYFLKPSHREYLKELFDSNLLMASDYRGERTWRSLIEPYSGLKYFYSFSINSGGPGDIGVFGDRGFGVGMHLWGVDRTIAYSGNYDLLKCLWADTRPLAPMDAVIDGKTVTLDKTFGYLKNVHDWAYMFAGSNDCGDNGPVVDCAQATFAGHAAYMRMARKVGTAEDIAKGAYYLAKSLPGLLGRSVFKDYGIKQGVFGVDRVNVGFRESLTRDCFANQSRFGNTYVGSFNANLCYASTDDGFDIYFPYSRYIWNFLRKENKLKELYNPNYNTDRKLAGGNHSDDCNHLLFMMLDGHNLDQLYRMYRNIAGKSHYVSDLGLLPLLMSGGSPLVLTDWYPLGLPDDFCFIPSEKTVRMKFKKVPGDYKLHALSSKRPLKIKAQGQEISGWEYSADSNKLIVAVPAGKDVILEIVYDKVDFSHFNPLPVPARPKTALPMQGEIDYINFDRAKQPENKTQETNAAKESSTVFFKSSFDGTPAKASKVSGGFSFNNWAGAKVEISGGVTGDAPAKGVPAQSLEIKAADKGFSGRMSAPLSIPNDFKEIIIKGEFMVSADYKGNYPMVFLWVTDKDNKGKPFFHDMKTFKSGSWNEFTFKLPRERLADSIANIRINLTSRRDDAIKEYGGCVFFRNLNAKVLKQTKRR